jgi:hypothetical protein
MNDFASPNRDRRGARAERPGGTPAPESGSYEQLNVFGRATGHRVTARQGETLPDLPRGFSWRLARDAGGQRGGGR